MGVPPKSNFSLPLILSLLLVFFLQTSTTASGREIKYSKQVSSLKLKRIRTHLSKINKPPVLSVTSPDADIIDCVQKTKQPAFDHPLLKNHKIQKEAPEWPRLKNRNQDIGGRKSEKRERRLWQMWHKNGTECPKGTVPVRRTRLDDVFRAKSLLHFGKKLRRSNSLPTPSDARDVVSANGHEHAIAYTGRSEEMYGAKAMINVWNPSIELVNEFSLSQIWIIAGSFKGSDLNSIEAGWQVSPELYGDTQPRLFTYWTVQFLSSLLQIPSYFGNDAYQATGCYNLLCSGFIQTNRKIAIGAAISPISSTSLNRLYDITILIWKDPKLGNWWMGIGENSTTLVGYWPAELFNNLADHATMVEWGGEVVNSRASGGHTSTQMGSGRFADEGFGKASYFRNLEIVDSDNSLSSARDISTLAENTNCYNIKSSYNNQWGTYFYYGGPGNNPRCQ